MSALQRFTVSLGSITLATFVLVGGSGWATEPASETGQSTPEERLRRFVHQVHIHGIQFQEAKSLTDFPGAVDILLGVLDPLGSDLTNTNSIILLGFAGEAKAFAKLAVFLEGAPLHEGPLRPMEVFARSYVPVAMGCILAQTTDPADRQKIFAYLQGGLTPDQWRQRVKWSGPYEGDEFADLARSTIRGLGLCGHPEAAGQLDRVKEQVRKQQAGWKCLRGAEKAQVLEMIEEARKTSRKVSQDGLRAYYSSQK